VSFKKEILETIKGLPPMSPAQNKIVTMLGAPDVNINEVIELIQYDPAVTSGVLKLVNSAYFGLSQQVTSIKQAVVLLGFKQVHRIVLTVSFSPVMNSKISGYGLPSGALWQHSVATAVASETIARTIEYPQADEAFTAALMHDIGKIALSSFVDEYYQRIDEESRAAGESFEVIEKKILGIDHAEAGAIILKNWGIPKNLFMPVLWHHSPETCTDNDVSPIVDIVHLADNLCIASGFGVGRDGLQYRISPAVMHRLRFKSTMLESIMSQTMTGIDNIKEIFEI
jgi:putative nucleotidyltransferase with HDIG domain